MSQTSIDIQYMGRSGITQECLEAIMRLVQYDDRIKSARILSAAGEHAFVLTIARGDWVAIKTGFASGYSGEGPRKLSYVLQLLQALNVEIEEYDVDKGVLERLDNNALTNADIKNIESLRPVRPQRYHDYIDFGDYERFRNGTLLEEFRAVVPFAIIDPAIADLAVTFFDNPDDKLMTGYRRLEDNIRKRTGSDEHGSRLFSFAFNPPSAKLVWKGLGNGEQSARAALFASAFGAHRNPRAHKESDVGSPNQLSEFLLLNHLFLLLRDAV